MSAKVAIVTAAGSGMGAQVVRRLAADGYHVAVLSSSGKGEALAGELGGIGVTGSNQSTGDLERLGGGAPGKMGRLRGLGQNARPGPPAPPPRNTRAPGAPG